MALTRPRIGQFNTTVTSLSDPITVLHGGATQANVDIGFLMNRANGLVSNVSLYWNESGNTFVTAFTTDSGSTNSNISLTSYANLSIGSLTVTGAILPSANVSYDLGSPTQRFKTLYLSGNTIDLGGANISAYNGQVTFATASGDLANGVFANITANSGIASTSTTTGALVVEGGAGITGNVFVGNLVATGFYNSDGSSFLGGYGNSQVATYLPIDPTITQLEANIGSFYTYANLHFADSSYGNTQVSAYLPADLTIVTIQNDIIGANSAIVSANTSIKNYVDTVISIIDANLGTATTNITTLFGNAATQATAIDALDANIGLYQTTTDANLGTATTNITTLFGNAAIQATAIEILQTQVYSNSNVASYLPSYSGTISGTLSTTNQPNITSLGTLTSLAVTGAASVGGSLTVSGNLNVTGNLTTFNSNDLVVNDSIIYIANGNFGDALDIGLVGHFINPGYQHTGFVRDATDGTWKLFSNVLTEPTTTVDFTNAIYSNLRIGNLDTVSATLTGILVLPDVGDVSANIGEYQTTINANLGTATTNITTLFSNAATQATLIAGIADGTITLANVITTGGVFWANGNVYGGGTGGGTTYTSTGAGNITVSGSTLSLTTTGPGAVTVGSSTDIPVVTTDVYGRISTTSTAAVVAPAATLSGSTLASGVTASSLTSVGNLTTLSVAGTSNRGGKAMVTNYTGATAPADPQQGDEWWYTTGNVLYKYINDGTTSAWVNINSSLYNASTSATANTLALRDTNGNLTATNFIGVASSAKYADLAEIYVSDQSYNPGTVVIFGGTEEITATDKSHDPRVAGVISTNPAYLMNSECSGLPVAFTGRVPCLVQGPIKKGDLLVTSNKPGVAQAIDNSRFVPGCVIGKSLENITTNTITTIEVVVGRF